MNPSDQITAYIDKLGDWRGKTVAMPPAPSSRSMR